MSELPPDPLRSAGLRSTAPRRAVLACMEQAKAPLSHGEVVDRLPEWDRATVFRNLVALTEVGLLRRVDLGDHVWRYERKPAAEHSIVAGEHHAHFTCTDCGTVACVDGVVVTVPQGLSVPHRGLEVQLRGVCEDCSD